MVSILHYAACQNEFGETNSFMQCIASVLLCVIMFMYAGDGEKCMRTYVHTYVCVCMFHVPVWCICV